MKTSQSQKTSEVWKKTKYANLVRYVPSGTLFARLKVRGKLIRESLDTGDLAVAHRKLRELERKARGAADDAHQGPPFLAGTKVPSTKHSLRSIPPASLRCCARVSNKRSKTPERTQFWKRRWAVWCEPYRSGMSSQRAPLRKIHKIPLRTVRLSVHGRPRPSSRTGSSGRMVSTSFHCSFVKSIHNYLSMNEKSTSTKLYYL